MGGNSFEFHDSYVLLYLVFMMIIGVYFTERLRKTIPYPDIF